MKVEFVVLLYDWFLNPFFKIFLDAGFFVFPDLSVRTEGSYRLKLSLFEVVS